MSFNNKVMLDLETVGVSAGCVVLSIGAATFDLEKDFYRKISLASSIDRGLKINHETSAWWNKQDKEARKEAFSGTLDLVTVLGEFSDWFSKLPKGTTIWGNGADFDLPILKAAYEICNMKVPWGNWDGRCYRTLKNLYPAIKMEKFQGVKHNALADAKNQAVHAVSLLSFHYRD